MMNEKAGGSHDPEARADGYREARSEAIAGLKDRIACEIEQSGPIRFDRFMAMALYDADGGYYSRPGRVVGREGDFFTSVSVGPLFGRLLADHIASWRAGGSGPWRILELGAHDASMASDILEHLKSTRPELLEGLEYAIVEPLDELAVRQRENLASFPDQVRIVRKISELEVRPGFLVANELIDALPCRLVESTGEGWIELGVSLEGGAFHWQSLGPAEKDAVRDLPLRPTGYRTEVRPDLKDFLAPIAECLTGGRMLWIDYGFERDDYYAEPRTEGTLRTFENHRAADDPLDAPGSRDITAHVDFTALGEAMESLGGRVIRFENQARFLTDLAKPLLLSLEGRTDSEVMKLIRQFQTLTHPGQLGSRFHVMEAEFPA